MLLGLSPLEIDAIRLSLEVSVSAMVWSLPVAVWVAWLLARKDFYGKSIVGGIIHLPLVLPPVVIGYLLLVAMGRPRCAPAGRQSARWLPWGAMALSVNIYINGSD